MNKEEFEKKISPMGLDSLRELCITGRSFYKTYPLNVARYALEDIIKGGGHSLRDVPNYSEPMSPAKGIPPLVRYIQQTPDLYQSADFLAKEFFGEMPDQPLVGFHRLAQGWVRPEDTDSAEKIEVTDSTEKIEESLDNSIDDSTATEPGEDQEPVGDDEAEEESGDDHACHETGCGRSRAPGRTCGVTVGGLCRGRRAGAPWATLDPPLGGTPTLGSPERKVAP